MGHIIDPNPWDNPEELTPVQTGCLDCLAVCPWTDKTDPPLTKELGNLWYQAHRQICSQADDWTAEWELKQ